MTFALFATATITANADDYALLNNYPLLNDMKMAKKQQTLLNEMRSTISDHKNNNKVKLSHLKKEFTSVINGLSTGDKTLNLHGTELVVLKNRIKTIQLLWSQEKTMLDSAVNNRMYEDDAYATIDKLSANLSALNKLYTQSYTRYKQNSIMKSLVQSYMNTNNPTEPRYALNIVKK